MEEDAAEVIKTLVENQKDIPKEFAEILDENWEDLLL